MYCRCTFVAATIAIVAMTCISEVTSSSCSEFNQFHDFVCPFGKPVTQVSGYYDSIRRDRRYCYGCQTQANATDDTELCYYTDVGRGGKLCALNWYITGFRSSYDNVREDRYFDIKCCRAISDMCTKNCNILDGPLNDLEGDVNYSLKAGQVMVGAVALYYSDKK